MHFLKDYSQRWGDVLKNTDHKGHGPCFQGCEPGGDDPSRHSQEITHFGRYTWGIFPEVPVWFLLIIVIHVEKKCWSFCYNTVMQLQIVDICWYIPSQSIIQCLLSIPFLAACSSTPLRTAMAGVTAHGVTVARSYAETKIESYEQRDGHARWAPPHLRRFHHTGESYIWATFKNPYDIPLYGLVDTDPYWPIVTPDDINAMVFQGFLKKKNLYLRLYHLLYHL